MKKLLNISLSFLMIFTVAFATIETVDSEPAFADASKAFACKSSSGDLYGYQTQQSSSAINVYRYNVETAKTVNVKSYTNLGNTRVSNFKDIKASAMDDQGHMFAIAKNKRNNLIPYYLPSNSTRGVEVGKSVRISAIYDAGTYFEYNDKKYVMASKGFFGQAKGWILPDSYSYGGSLWNTVNFNVDTSGTSAILNQVDDIAWLRDGSAWPQESGKSPSFVGYDVSNEKVVLGYITSESGGTFNIRVKDHDLDRGTWNKTNNVGAVFAFGGEEIYAVYNGTGEVRKISYNGSSFSFGTSLGNMTKTSKNDGSACHTGTPKQYWEPSASLSGLSACDGEGKKLQVTLRNP